MNPSRISYSYPVDSNSFYPKDVILKPCEFCSRTFIPDSLIRHKKICYKDFLKKRTQITKHSQSKLEKLNGSDIPGMNISELMIKRQIRRMQWRGRHEEFINSIREAREYAIATNNGLKVPIPSSTEHKEDMHQCKYCLRKFQKDSLEKHLKRCKEYSIQSNRMRPNDAQIEAKRRLSLRLYYKPKSYRGDSPDNLNTSISSNDFDDYQSAVTDNSHTPFYYNKSPESISIANSVIIDSLSKVKHVSNQRLITPVVPYNNRRHKSAGRRSDQLPVEAVSCSSVSIKSETANPMSENRIKKVSSKTKEITKSSQNKKYHENYKFNNKSNSNNLESIHSSKTLKSYTNKSKNDYMFSKSKDNSMFPNQNIITPKFIELEASLIKPDPGESLRKAKEIINFLEERTQQKEHSKSCKLSLIENDCGSKINLWKENVQEPYSNLDATCPSFNEEKIQTENLNQCNENLIHSFQENIKGNNNNSTGSEKLMKSECDKCETPLPAVTDNSGIELSTVTTEKLVTETEHSMGNDPKENCSLLFTHQEYMKIWKMI